MRLLRNRKCKGFTVMIKPKDRHTLQEWNHCNEAIIFGVTFPFRYDDSIFGMGGDMGRVGIDYDYFG